MSIIAPDSRASSALPEKKYDTDEKVRGFFQAAVENVPRCRESRERVWLRRAVHNHRGYDATRSKASRLCRRKYNDALYREVTPGY